MRSAGRSPFTSSSASKLDAAATRLLSNGPAAATSWDLLHRIDRLAGVLRARGIGYGDRIALLAENRFESIELILAAARIGAIVACQNWRLTTAEQQHCVIRSHRPCWIHSPAQQTATDALGRASIPRLVFGQA
ncbi:MAG: AMP-binding protein [Gammaproteobacteria bacterium]|nr:AMP-binding protein [Gammaproteobacteria bacterium]